MNIPRKQPLEPHWNFALAATLGKLETLTWGFQSINAHTDERGDAFAGVPQPNELIAIIDAFLDEKDLFFQGDIRNLNDMRQYLEEYIAPIFESGREAARQYWGNIPWERRTQLTELKFEDFRAEAKSQAPENAKPSQKAWFIEGFSKSWQDQWMQYLITSLGKEPSPRKR